MAISELLLFPLKLLKSHRNCSYDGDLSKGVCSDCSVDLLFFCPSPTPPAALFLETQ